MDERLKTVEAGVEELATALLGPQRSRLAGGGRDEESGALRRLEALEERFNVMERRLSEALSKLDHVQETLDRRGLSTPVVVALIAGFSTVTSALVSSFMAGG